MRPSTRSEAHDRQADGLGRCGERVEKTPLRPDVLRGGSTLGRQPGFRWNQNTTQISSH